MLRTRVITAVILLASLIGILLFGGETGWSLFVGAVLLGAFWEWGRLGLFTPALAIVYAIAGVMVYLGTAFLPAQSHPVQSFLYLASLFWLLIVPFCLRSVSIGVLANKALFALAGWVLIIAAGLALVVSKQQGIVFLLSIIAICFAADIFAYVFGKTLGRRKLAPRISPGKSWEGAAGGLLSVVALSWVTVYLATDYPLLKATWQVHAHEHWGATAFTFWLVVLSGFSIVGDLFESMLKRRAGLKDSSQLLPGHGGILDRIDAQLPVMPMAILLSGVSLV
ncbi:MAG TPA: phosphatidate cytidylyltransferase [Limnobacter sp.]|nr:phosphatidate cytidylyltransferase [Limnobacter sp.]